MRCPCFDGCPFVNERKKTAIKFYDDHVMNFYCKNNYTLCARYSVFIKFGRPAVPSNLLPEQKERAQQIIESLSEPENPS